MDMEMPQLRIGERMQQLRKETGITQEELGRIVGIEKSAISAYEEDIRLPIAVIAARIAKALGVTLDYLCGLTDDKRGFRIEKELTIDTSVLNMEGIKELCNYYNYLCTQDKYLEHPEQHGQTQ